MGVQIPIFKRDLVYTLAAKQEENLELYLGEGFNDYFEKMDLRSHIREVSGTNLEVDDLTNLRKDSGGENDAANAFIVFNMLTGVTPYLASDDRVWVAITHTVGFKWARDRWLKQYRPIGKLDEKTKKEALQSIRNHFFCKGNRGFFRDNAFSSLWWYAYLMSRIDRNRLPELLTTILKSTDVRSQLLDRSTTSRPVNVLHALIKVIERERPKHEDWFTRKKNRGVYKTWMGKINMLGGSTIFETKTVDELEGIFSDLLRDSAQE